MKREQAAGSPVDPRLGLTLGGRYVLTALCGSGGMGSVYEGVHQDLGRKVAVKCLHPHLAQSPAFVARFIREARLASRLAHPNIVRIYDFGNEETAAGQEVYLVMEFCSGRQLGDLIAQEARFPLARVRAIMTQVLSALAEVHDHGIVHRDVKPENVVLEIGARGTEVAKLIDFGIAETKGYQRDGTIAGTAGYLSPEVIRGGAVDHRADLYAAGCMLFELVTGRPLFDAGSIADVLSLQLAMERPDPRLVAPDRGISDPLAEVCMRSVAHDARARFSDADEFADVLTAAVAPPTPAPQSSPWSSSGSEPARPPQRSEPQIRSYTPSGRYSYSAGEDRASGEHPSTRSRAPVFAALRELENDAHAAMTRRRWNDAIEKLKRGVDIATELTQSEKADLGGAALRSFGRRLGEALRKDGRSLEAIEMLRKLLVHAPENELSRALLLEEVGLNAAAAGLSGDAVGAFLDAAEAARACGNAAVEQRLLGRIRASGRS